MAEAQSNQSMTLGEQRVRISFNPSTNENVDKIKRMAADFIDHCESMKTSITPSEVNRSLSIAQTEIEAAAMWAVKGATA